LNVASPVPRLLVTAAPRTWDSADLAALDWQSVPTLSPFIRADGGAPAVQQTRVRVAATRRFLYAHFDCDDRDIWGTYTRRDEPIYDEEVVEIFIGPGSDDLHDYFEFQVSPNGVLFDATIHNPTWERSALQVNTAWDCPGIRWWAARHDDRGRWQGTFAIPWAELHPTGSQVRDWRANFYRIERPHNDAPEYSCWSPTLTEPADYHKPYRFGFLGLPDLN
jgi:hypothetical protein